MADRSDDPSLLRPKNPPPRGTVRRSGPASEGAPPSEPLDPERTTADYRLPPELFQGPDPFEEDSAPGAATFVDSATVQDAEPWAEEHATEAPDGPSEAGHRGDAQTVDGQTGAAPAFEAPLPGLRLPTPLWAEPSPDPSPGPEPERDRASGRKRAGDGSTEGPRVPVVGGVSARGPGPKPWIWLAGASLLLFGVMGFVWLAAQRPKGQFGEGYRPETPLRAQPQMQSPREAREARERGGRSSGPGRAAPERTESVRRGRPNVTPRPHSARRWTPERVQALREQHGDQLPVEEVETVQPLSRYAGNAKPADLPPALEVRSVPPRAQVWLDGKRVGRTPLYLGLPASVPATLDVEIRMKGYESARATLRRDSNNRYALARILKPVTASE